MYLPSEKILEQKKAVVADIAERLTKSVAGVLVNYKGITVADDTQLRRQLREAGVKYTVVKNTLLKRAAEAANINGFEPVLENTTALATSEEDYVAAARILCEYADKNDNFAIKLGYVDGDILDVGGVKELAKLPSKEVLVAKALGGLNAPISGFVTVLNGNIRGLACVLSAIAEQKGA